MIAGEKRGLQLRAPSGLRTRPTADRVKESVFAILTPLLGDAAVLDLFAGSGALAIEALSRGAKHAVLVEQDRRVAEVVERNLVHTGLAGTAKLLKMQASRAISILGRQGEQFALILMDPPYEQGLVVPTLQALSRARLCAPGGLVVVEHGYREEIPAIVENFSRTRQEVYKDTRVSFLSESGIPLD